MSCLGNIQAKVLEKHTDEDPTGKQKVYMRLKGREGPI